MKKLLSRICDRLHGIAYDDLTTAERAIVNLLIEAKLLYREGNDLHKTSEETNERQSFR